MHTKTIQNDRALHCCESGRHRRPRPIATAILLGSVAAWSFAPASAGAESARTVMPFAKADLFFELNDTAGDLGFQAFIDGEPWRLLEIEKPNDVKVLSVSTSSSLHTQGLTEFFIESSEPPFEDLPPDVFFGRFPEGLYEISGQTLDGRELESVDTISHIMPAAPSRITVSGKEPTDACEGPVPFPAVAEPLAIVWDRVTSFHPTVGRPGPISIVGYNIILDRLSPTPLKYTVELGANSNRLTIPAGITRPGDAFKMEIQVREAGGNLTAIERCFTVRR